MPIKAIFFDMDGTLVHMPGSTPQEWLMSVYTRLGLDFEFAKVQQAYKAAEEQWKRRVRVSLGYSRASFVEWNRLILKELGIDGDVKSLAERVQNGFENPTDELFPEVRQVLEELKRRKLTLGILSHRPLGAIRSSLKSHKIEKYFACLVNPQEAGAFFGKLDEKLWQYALDKLDVKPAEAMHVGDDYETDVLGAKQGGLMPVLLDRTGRHHKADCLKLNDLTGLLDVSKSCNANHS